LAHGLKGSAATVGAAAAREAAERLEQAGAVGNWQGIETSLPTLRHELERLTAALRELVPAAT
jgi:HPt (histidine-containing phosphotransfer) domain-containing protein